MTNQEILEKLQSFKEQLEGPVIDAYKQGGYTFGQAKFAAWRKILTQFLNQHLPGESVKLNNKLRIDVFYTGRGETDLDIFMKDYGRSCFDYLDQLRNTIEATEFRNFVKQSTTIKSVEKKVNISVDTKKILIAMHGQDETMRSKVAEFIKKLAHPVVLLPDITNIDIPISDSIDACGELGFAIILYTQNNNTVIAPGIAFVQGYLSAKLSPSQVIALIPQTITLPSNMGKTVYSNIDAMWQIEIAKAMRNVGYTIDFNNVI